MSAADSDHKRNPADQRFLSSCVELITATQHDSNNEAVVSRGLLLDAAGDISFVTEKGTTVVLGSLAVGVIHPIRVKRVNDTGTSIADADIFLVY